MIRKNIGHVLLLTVIEMLLMIIIFFIVVFGSSYIQSNVYLFTDFAVLQHSSGMEKILMAIYLGCNALFMIFISLVLLELILFLGRSMVKSALSAYRKISLKSTDKVDHVIKQISLIALFKRMKINTPKRAIIAYVILIIMLFGVKIVAKQVMKASDTFVYRVYENIHLNTETGSHDFTSAILNEEEYTLQIDTSVGNIHLYQMKDETEANFVFLYDTAMQLSEYSISIDEENKTIEVSFNQSVLSYLEYVDPLRPQVELYLPEDLVLTNAEILIEVSGDVVVDYTGMDSLSVEVTDSEVSISAINRIINNIELNATSSKIRIQTKSLISSSIILHDCEASFTFGEIFTTLDLQANANSTVKLYSLVVAQLLISSQDSDLELREVYADVIIAELENVVYQHLNGSVTRQPESYTIIQTNSTIVLRGVESGS